jgi:hypothetical protein
MTEGSDARQWSIDLARLAALIIRSHRSAAHIARSFTIIDVRRPRPRPKRTRDATTERFPAR